MPSSALAARLAHLPQPELVELLATLALDSAEVQRAADAALSRSVPLPTWALERVLLDEDLLPHVMEKVGVTDAVAPVCTAWQDVRERELTRRLQPESVLRPSALQQLRQSWKEQEEHELFANAFGATEVPAGFAVSRWGESHGDGTVQVVSRDGQPLLSIAVGSPCAMACDGESLFVVHGDVYVTATASVSKFNLQDGSKQGSFSHSIDFHEISFGGLVVHRGLLYLADTSWGEIYVIDAATMQWERRKRFPPLDEHDDDEPWNPQHRELREEGQDFLKAPYGLAAHEENIFVLEIEGDLYHICVLDLYGDIVRRFGLRGQRAGRLLEPVDMVMVHAAAPMLVVSDDPPAGPRLTVFSLDGLPVQVVQMPAAPFGLEATRRFGLREEMVHGLAASRESLLVLKGPRGSSSRQFWLVPLVNGVN